MPGRKGFNRRQGNARRKRAAAMGRYHMGQGADSRNVPENAVEGFDTSGCPVWVHPETGRICGVRRTR